MINSTVASPSICCLIDAETLASNLADGGVLEDISKERDYTVLSAMNLKALEENLPGLVNQRQIVTWSFENTREIGDSKRFDFEVNGNAATVYSTKPRLL